MRSKICLAWELAEVASAVEAARLLGEAAVTQQLGSEYDQDKAVPCATAVLALVVCRLRDLTRAMNGSLDPAHLSAPHNSVSGDVAGLGPVLVGRPEARR